MKRTATAPQLSLAYFLPADAPAPAAPAPAAPAPAPAAPAPAIVPDVLNPIEVRALKERRALHRRLAMIAPPAPAPEVRALVCIPAAPVLDARAFDSLDDAIEAVRALLPAPAPVRAPRVRRAIPQHGTPEYRAWMIDKWGDLAVDLV